MRTAGHPGGFDGLSQWRPGLANHPRGEFRPRAPSEKSDRNQKADGLQSDGASRWTRGQGLGHLRPAQTVKSCRVVSPFRIAEVAWETGQGLGRQRRPVWVSPRTGHPIVRVIL